MSCWGGPPCVQMVITVLAAWRGGSSRPETPGSLRPLAACRRGRKWGPPVDDGGGGWAWPEGAGGEGAWGGVRRGSEPVLVPVSRLAEAGVIRRLFGGFGGDLVGLRAVHLPDFLERSVADEVQERDQDREQKGQIRVGFFLSHRRGPPVRRGGEPPCGVGVALQRPTHCRSRWVWRPVEISGR